MRKLFTKFLSPVLALLIMLSIFTVYPVTASAETGGNFGDFEYWIYDDGTVEIESYSGSERDLIIPSKIAGRTVTNISSYAFSYCNTLISVTIPESIIYLDGWTFCDCASLENIYVSENNKFFADIDGVLYNKDITELIKYPEGKKETQYVIPNSVISIGDSAFYNSVSLISVTIPDSVANIGNSAFSDCVNLSSITIPDSVTSVGVWAFDNTAWYDNQPAGVVYISNIVYGYRGELPETSVTLKEGTSYICDYAFYACEELTSITIPDSVTSIGYYAFGGCTNLESVTIGSGVTNIDAWVFSGCSSLENIYISGNNTFFADVDGVLFNKDITELIKYPEGKKETQYDIPSSVISISNFAFANSEELTSITISDSVISIGGSAFYNCISLENVTIPDSVTSIDVFAFSDCSGLVSATIGNGVKRIASGTFSECSSLSSITIPDSVESIGTFAFSDCTSLENITIPDSVEGIGMSAFSNTVWYNNQPDGLIYIGKVVYEYKGRMPRNTSVTLKEGTKSIADYAFSDCENLSEITIPNSVKSIGNMAFYYCTRLTSVTIPEGVVSIGYGAFRNCKNLTSVTISATVKEIGSSAFGYFEDEIFWDDDIFWNISKIEGFTIYGYTGTEAEAYAKEEDFIFIPIESDIIMGDADGDGDLNVKDATHIQMYLANFIDKDEIDLSVCDVDGDNDISVKDATHIQMQIAGFI